MGAALSERVFYPPAIRIANHLGWTSRVEYPVNSVRNGTGDYKRIDLRLDRRKTCVLVEVKWEPNPDRHWCITLPANEKEKFSSLSIEDLGMQVSYAVCVQLVIGRLNLTSSKGGRFGRDAKGLQLYDGDLQPNGRSPYKSVLHGESALKYFSNAYVVGEIGPAGVMPIR